MRSRIRIEIEGFVGAAADFVVAPEMDCLLGRGPCVEVVGVLRATLRASPMAWRTLMALLSRSRQFNAMTADDISDAVISIVSIVSLGQNWSGMNAGMTRLFLLHNFFEQNVCRWHAD